MAVCVLELDSKHLISDYECNDSKNRIGQYDVEHNLSLGSVQMFLLEILMHSVHENLHYIPT